MMSIMQNRNQATKRMECTIRPFRPCATPGCTLHDFHSEPHSFEVVWGEKRNAKRSCMLIGLSDDKEKRQKKIPLPLVRDDTAVLGEQDTETVSSDTETVSSDSGLAKSAPVTVLCQPRASPVMYAADQPTSKPVPKKPPLGMVKQLHLSIAAELGVERVADPKYSQAFADILTDALAEKLPPGVTVAPSDTQFLSKPKLLAAHLMTVRKKPIAAFFVPDEDPASDKGVLALVVRGSNKQTHPRFIKVDDDQLCSAITGAVHTTLPNSAAHFHPWFSSLVLNFVDHYGADLNAVKLATATPALVDSRIAIIVMPPLDKKLESILHKLAIDVAPEKVNAKELEDHFLKWTQTAMSGGFPRLEERIACLKSIVSARVAFDQEKDLVERNAILADDEPAAPESVCTDSLHTSTLNTEVEQTNDAYDSSAKQITRFSFGTYCLEASKSTDRKDILYLESPHGGATKELLKYFNPKNLYPCNKSPDAIASLKKLFPDVCAVKGNIYKVYKTREWLGVWFDTEETWQHIHHPGQPWKLDHIPSFDRACIIAVTLTIGSGPNPVKGGAEALGVELAQLMQDRDGKMDLLPFPYDGKGGRMNMVFGIAKFKVDKTWELKDYMYARVHVPAKHLGKFNGMEDYMVKDGHYIGTVLVQDDKLMVVYMTKDGNFFDVPDPSDELSVEQVKQWIQF